ncbi:histidine phosphatase superfamily [Aspergillus californicus]
MILSLLALSGGFVSSVTAETILGVTVYSRHGDRTSKHYPGYMLTNLGLQQNYQVGSDYRDLYISSTSPKRILGISETKYHPTEVFGYAPDEPVLLNTATAFLQGLYPPLDTLDDEISSQSLNNGSSYTNPLHGYQYVVLHGEEKESPDTIWIKGDDECAAVTDIVDTFTASAEYTELLDSTRSFYESFWPLLGDVYDYTEADLSYENAYDIFDLLHTANIHNASMNGTVSEEDLFQLRTLADGHEYRSNFNPSTPDTAIGARTLSQAILSHLNETVTSQGRTKFSLLAGSYDTMLAFFGLMELPSASGDFYGLPEYASTMAFELFAESDEVASFPDDSEDLKVRFLFRNGSDAGAGLRPFALFGGEDEVLSWSSFVTQMQSRAISTVAEWCDVCKSTQGFCLAETADLTATERGSGGGGISNAVAGLIGSVVTLAVIGVGVGAGTFLLRRRKRTTLVAGDMAEKGSLGSMSS